MVVELSFYSKILPLHQQNLKAGNKGYCKCISIGCLPMH